MSLNMHVNLSRISHRGLKREARESSHKYFISLAMSSSTANCHILLGDRMPAHAVGWGSHGISPFLCNLRAEHPPHLRPGSEEPGSFHTTRRGTRDPDRHMHVATSNPPAHTRPGRPDPFPAACWLMPVQGSAAVPSTAPLWLPGGLEHRCVTAQEVGGGPLGGQHGGNTIPSSWELCGGSLAACDKAWVILLVKMVRPEAFVRHGPGSTDQGICSPGSVSLQALLKCDLAATGARDQKMLRGAETLSCASRCWSKFGEVLHL